MEQRLPRAEPRTGERHVVVRVLIVALPMLLFIPFFVIDAPLCPSKHFFGAPCPGCGLTRATEAFLVGDFAASLSFHPLMPIITPMVAFMLIRSTLVAAGAIKSTTFDLFGRLPHWFWGAMIVLVIGVWIARLAGYLGGHPDPLEPENGYIFQVLGIY